MAVVCAKRYAGAIFTSSLDYSYAGQERRLRRRIAATARTNIVTFFVRHSCHDCSGDFHYHTVAVYNLVRLVWMQAVHIVIYNLAVCPC